MQHAGQSHDESRSRLEEMLRHLLAIGATLVVCLPAARGFSETLGWLPLWLLLMPATALWALRGFPLPARAEARDPAITKAPRHRRSGPQARRRARVVAHGRLPRAA